MEAYVTKYKPQQFAVAIFDVIEQFTQGVRTAFKKNACKEYEEVLLSGFFLSFGIESVDYYIFKRTGEHNKEVLIKLYSLYYEHLYKSYSEAEVKLISVNQLKMENAIKEAFELDFEDAENNPIINSAFYVQNIINYNDVDFLEWNRINLALFMTLKELYLEIARIVYGTKIEY